MADVLLVDVDSKIPNLALMKLSAYHKSIGDKVSLERLDAPYYPTRKKPSFYIPMWYDKAYCSVIFEGNESVVKGNAEFGGTGISLNKDLPDHIEKMEPDYSIYPNNDTSYGFISRGCIRNCYFCKVPEKEGMIKQVSQVDDIVRHKKVKFMDNNVLALPNHLDILQEIADKKIRCAFNQGLDLRLVTEENSNLLSRLNYMGEYVFAFDDWSYLKSLEKKLELLRWRKDWRFKFFVYCHPDMEMLNIINRIKWLKERRMLPYVMRDIACWESQQNDFYVDMASWCNQPSLFKKLEFGEFLEKRHTNQSRIDISLSKWKG